MTSRHVRYIREFPDNNNHKGAQSTLVACGPLSSISLDKIEFEEVRNGNNFPFNRKDSTYREAVIPKISCSALKMAAL